MQLLFKSHTKKSYKEFYNEYILPRLLCCQVVTSDGSENDIESVIKHAESHKGLSSLDFTQDNTTYVAKVSCVWYNGKVLSIKWGNNSNTNELAGVTIYIDTFDDSDTIAEIKVVCCDLEVADTHEQALQIKEYLKVPSSQMSLVVSDYDVTLNHMSKLPCNNQQLDEHLYGIFRERGEISPAKKLALYVYRFKCYLLVDTFHKDLTIHPAMRTWLGLMLPTANRKMSHSLYRELIQLSQNTTVEWVSDNIATTLMSDHCNYIASSDDVCECRGDV